MGQESLICVLNDQSTCSFLTKKDLMTHFCKESNIKFILANQAISKHEIIILNK